MDEAAKEYAENRSHFAKIPSGEIVNVYDLSAEEGFKAGAKWMAEQGETIEGEICIPNAFNNPKDGAELVVRAELSKDRGFRFGDKVIVQIRKEEK